MSNFICSECGMTNIDCGGAGYKTPKEIELEKENKRLQKQLKEANEAIKQYAWDSGYWESGYHYKDSFFANVYINKWGVK